MSEHLTNIRLSIALSWGIALALGAQAQAQSSRGPQTPAAQSPAARAVVKEAPAKDPSAGRFTKPDLGRSLVAEAARKVLADPESTPRQLHEAIQGLVASQRVEADEVLLEAVSHRSVSVRHAALAALRAVRPAAAKTLPVLLKAVRDGEWITKRGPIGAEAAELLGSYGREAEGLIPELLRLEQDAELHQFTRYAVSAALGNIAPERFPFRARGETAIRPLAMVLRNEQGEVERTRQAALRLYHYDSLPAAVVEELGQLLEVADGETRLRLAATVLRHAENPRAAQVLEAGSGLEDEPLRKLAVELSSRAAHLPRRASILERATRDESAEVRRLAIIALDSPSVLIGGLSDSDPNVRAGVASALERREPLLTAAVPALRLRLEDDSPLVRIAAARAVWALAKDREALETLAEIVARGAPEVRWRAISALRNFPPDLLAGQLPSLIDLLTSDDQRSATLAYSVLRPLGRQAGEQRTRVQELLRHEQEAVRRRATRLLQAWDRQADAEPQAVDPELPELP